MMSSLGPAIPPPELASPRQEEPPSYFRRGIGLSLALLVGLGVALIPSPLHDLPGLGHRPAHAAAVALSMATLWLFEALPIAVTACLPLVLFPLLGVFGKGPLGDLRRSAEPFADAYIFLFLGGMAIGAGMEQHGLHRRVALQIMRAIGTNPKRLLLGMLVATSTVSLWISNTATAVMMLPIGLAVIAQLEKSLGGRKLVHFGTALMLAIAYAANVGGVGTKIGTGTNSIFCGFVAEELNYDITFPHYMAIGLPFVILFTPVLWFALWRIGKQDEIGEQQVEETLERELATMGPMSAGEKKVATVFAAAAMLWIFGDPLRKGITPHIPLPWEGFKIQAKHYEAAVATFAMISMFVARTLSFASLKKIPWSTLLLLGGSFAMAEGIEGSGLGKWLAGEMRIVSELPLIQQFGLASFGTVLMSAFASNTATVNVTLNVLPRNLGVLTASAIAASCDFMLPAGTPPNAIVFGSKYVRLPVMMKVGFLLDIVASALITAYCYLYVRHLF